MGIDSHKLFLKKRNLRATQQRLNLMTTLNQFGSAMPYSKIKEELGQLDRVTLYRNLEDLTQHGIIHKAYQDGEDVFYALCPKSCSSVTHKHDHIHFKCNSCKRVTCEKAEYSLGLKDDMLEIDSVSISIEGKCKNCKISG